MNDLEHRVSELEDRVSRLDAWISARLEEEADARTSQFSEAEYRMREREDIEKGTKL